MKFETVVYVAIITRRTNITINHQASNRCTPTASNHQTLVFSPWSACVIARARLAAPRRHSSSCSTDAAWKRLINSLQARHTLSPRVKSTALCDSRVRVLFRRFSRDVSCSRYVLFNLSSWRALSRTHSAFVLYFITLSCPYSFICSFTAALK